MEADHEFSVYPDVVGSGRVFDRIANVNITSKQDGSQFNFNPN